MTASGGAPVVIRRVLVVDDDAALRAAVRRALEAESFVVDEAESGVEALAAAKRHAPDAVVLDLGLPEMSGFDVLAELRRAASMPILVLSGRAEESDRVAAFEMGADDYVVKPFLSRELAARVRSLLRRGPVVAPIERMTFGSLVVDPHAREVLVDGVTIAFTTKEFDVLAYLAMAPRRAISRDEVLRAVWDSSGEWQDPETVTEHIRRIRHKIADSRDGHQWIATVRGVGYRFEPGSPTAPEAKSA